MRVDANAVQDWFDRNASGLVEGGVRVALIVLIALVVRALLHRLVSRLVRTASEGTVPVALRPLRDRARGTVFEPSPLLSERRRQRADTLGSVLRSIASCTVAFVAGAMTLSELGLDLAPVVASAGIVGVAVGFGAQNLVKDFLTGMFMLLEDQYGVGDVIDAGEATGTVESVTLRTTRLRDVQGTVWHIRNGEITRIGNKSQGWARALLDIPIDLSSDVPAVRALALQVASALCEEEEYADKVLEDPEVWGVQALSADGLVLRIALKTAPLQQWTVERALRERLMAAFDAHGILIGVPLHAVREAAPHDPPSDVGA